MDVDVFLVYLDKILLPAPAPEDIVAIDNMLAHKGAGVRTRIEKAGPKLLYLPLYSPGLNPGEMVFCKLKTILRKAAERAMPAPWQTIRTKLNEMEQQQ